LKTSTDRILTTHTGSLPRPSGLVGLLRKGDLGEPVDGREFDGAVRAAVDDVVRKQVAAGIAVVNDGEQGKPGYATYIKARVTGFGGENRVTTAWAEARDFPEYQARRTGNTRSTFLRPVCNGPIEWRDFEAVRREIDTLTAATRGAGAEEGRCAGAGSRGARPWSAAAGRP